MTNKMMYELLKEKAFEEGFASIVNYSQDLVISFATPIPDTQDDEIKKCKKCHRQMYSALSSCEHCEPEDDEIVGQPSIIGHLSGRTLFVLLEFLLLLTLLSLVVVLELILMFLLQKPLVVLGPFAYAFYPVLLELL